MLAKWINAAVQANN